MRRIRLVLILDSGQSMECEADLSSFKRFSDGWMYISLPTSAFRGKLNLESYKIKRVVISGDGSEPFTIGSITTIQEKTPLEAISAGSKEVAVNYRTAFSARSKSGSTGVKYSWDFDSSDGIQEDAVGAVTAHQFRKPGNYVVTLTVSDIYNIKKPATTVVKVKVNP